MRMKTIRIGVVVALLLIIGGGYAFQQLRLEGQRFLSDDPSVWTPVIADMLAEQADNKSPRDAVLLLGSSTIRFWESAEQDLAPLPVLRRGFGGAKLPDVIYHLDALIGDRQPRAVLIYIGSNDFSALFGNRVKSNAQVLALYQQLIEKLKARLGAKPIYFLALNPNTRGWSQWPLMAQANRDLAAFAAADPQVHLIDASDVLFDERGEANTDYLRFDGLHLNAEGYRVWGAAVRRQLLAAGLE